MKWLHTFLALIFISCFPDDTIVYTPINNIQEWTDIEVDILNQINIQIREEISIKPDKNLYIGAQERCNYFIELGDISHEYFENVSKKLRIKGLYPSAECIEKNHKTAESIVRAWKESPEHYAILKDKLFKYCGIARKECNGEFYTCIILSRPGIIE